MQTARQLSFFPVTDHIVNVATVPQRSPFRYPGGKTWLIPRIREWLGSLGKRPTELFEPFTGGGIVGLTVAFENLVSHVTMVEMDKEIAAVWQAIFAGEGPLLGERIVNFELSYEAVEAERSRTNPSLQERAFITILKNRTYHGGILAEGSGMIKYGENGKGIRSRWYPETLRRRILEIHALRHRFTFIEGDGLDVMRQNAHVMDAVFFIDPPYTAGGKRAGRRLYNHFELAHEELFRIASTLTGDFLMTYDDAEELHELAAKYGFDTEAIAMKNTHHAKMTELLIGRRLDWVRPAVQGLSRVG
ncbi:MAG: DNA adenine methylase [Chloroflexi bacterium]|nr:DNA adenine methylase [Chloroflexota bacterium]